MGERWCRVQHRQGGWWSVDGDQVVCTSSGRLDGGGYPCKKVIFGIITSITTIITFMSNTPPHVHTNDVSNYQCDKCNNDMNFHHAPTYPPPSRMNKY